MAGEIVDADLKPENVLVTNSMILKLADVGLAQDLTHQRPYLEHVRVGTPAYIRLSKHQE